MDKPDTPDLQAIIEAGGLNKDVTTLPGIVNAVVNIFLPLAGLVMLGLIIFAGFQILTGGNNPEQVEKGRKTLTQAIIGFLIIFAAYWIAQILEVIFAFPIVSK